MPKIAVCLICGNEEEIINRCLDSVFTVTDRVIVVRAIGSKTPDNTLRIAQERGCITGEYRNSIATRSWPFVDDFAAARNMSFALAIDQPEPPDWLMWMDCDDVLEDGMGEIIKSAVADCKEDWVLADYCCRSTASRFHASVYSDAARQHGSTECTRSVCRSATTLPARHSRCVFAAISASRMIRFPARVEARSET